MERHHEQRHYQVGLIVVVIAVLSYYFGLR